MASIAGYYLRRRVCQISVQLSHSNIKCLRRSRGIQWFSSGAESRRTEFAGENAYDLLGVSETSSFAEIKASFRKLAKETHPDLVEPKSDSAASQRFVKILAAYEILSDSGKRAHYDMYLLSQRRILEKHSVKGTRLWRSRSQITTFKQMEVVEWLKWYRYAINDIVSEKRVVVGTGYFDVLERDFYSAIHAAYYGPIIESMDLLPDRFEAEERSVYETPEVLHLVSGRDLFGIVRLVNEIPQISFACNEKLSSLASIDSGICPTFQNRGIHMSSGNGDNFGTPMMQSWNSTEHTSDAYKDLELHVSGKVVAVASRYPHKNCCDGRKKEDAGDKIHVFLSTHGYQSMDTIDELPTGHFSCGAVGSKIPLGTITGLGTSPDEGSCFVYDSNGTKTHVIMKHRTLLVCETSFL